MSIHPSVAKNVRREKVTSLRVMRLTGRDAGMLKKRILSLLTVVLLMAASASAFVQSRPDQRPKQKQTIVQANLEGTVEVSFKIDAQGHVEILSLASTSPQLADYVIKKLAQVKLEKGDPQVGQVIKYRFVFKKQA